MTFRKDLSSLALLLLLVTPMSFSACKKKGGTGVGASSYAVQTQSQWDGRRITGTVKNVGGSRIGFVSVEFELIDDRGRPIRTVSASHEGGIEPNGEWNFEIEASAVGATRTRLRNTTAR